MELPKVFAVYEEDNTLVVIKTSTEDGSLILEEWTPPTNDAWKDATSEERLELVEWFRGDRWFPIETHLTDELDVIKNRVIVDGKEYSWWRSTFELVWSNDKSINYCNGTLEKCLTKVPILEFSPRFELQPTEIPESPQDISDTDEEDESAETTESTESTDDSSTEVESVHSSSEEEEGEGYEGGGEEVEWLGNRPAKNDVVCTCEFNIVGLSAFILFLSLYYYVLTEKYKQ